MHDRVPAIDARGLVVERGGRRVLHGVSFEVGAGRIAGLLGPSGCGKSTLMRALVGVQRGVSGSLRILGLGAGSRLFVRGSRTFPRRWRCTRI